MDYKVPEFLLKPPSEPTEQEKKFDYLMERYLGAGLEDISTESLDWSPEGQKEFFKDIEYCIKHHINYYDYRPEMEDTDDDYY